MARFQGGEAALADGEMFAAFDRLTPEDMAELGHKIAARRGPGEGG